MFHVARRWWLLAVATVVTLLLTPSLAVAETPDEPWIEAESAIVVDAMTGEVLYSRDADVVRAMASLTKLFTAFIALETTPLDRIMNVTEADLVGEASMGLEAGESMTFKTLLHGMLLPSGNDAASAIARNLGDGSQERFMQRANARLQELGLESTHLVNPHGLDAEGHTSSARDIAALTLFALHHEPLFAASLATQAYTGDGHTLFSTNRFFNVYPGFVGGKTGVTDDAGYCLMQIAERDGRVVVAVLLGSTNDAWYSDAGELLDYGFATLAVPGHIVGSETVPTSIAQEPVRVEAPASAGLAVSSSADGVVVALPALESSRGWSPWFWVAAVSVLVPSFIVILVQVQRLLALIAFGSQSSQWRTQRATSGVSRPTTARRATAWETRPFGTLGSPAEHFQPPLEPAVDLLSINRWSGQPERRTSSDERQRPLVAPAIGGD